ncbi:MAG: DUF86 domain-containing protein [Psychrobium sp.]|nr:DUF86 domain-containing protein [Psychrobium sp.]
MGESYTLSMRGHLIVLESELKALSDIIEQRPFNQFEYRAAERTLQILIEACIGIAKQWSYGLSNIAPPDAYGAFERLSMLGEKLDGVDWRRIIGMRNALVHDYLNIDPTIIRSVIQRKDFEPLLVFANQGLDALEKMNK